VVILDGSIGNKLHNTVPVVGRISCIVYGIQYLRFTPNLYLISVFLITSIPDLKGIVSRDFVVCFLVSFNRSYISTHQERVLLLLKVRFRIEFFYLCVWAW
jgi:hypothetical protein